MQNLQLDLVVKQKQLLIVKIIKTYLTPDLEKIPKQQVNGKQTKAVNTMQPV